MLLTIHRNEPSGYPSLNPARPMVTGVSTSMRNRPSAKPTTMDHSAPCAEPLKKDTEEEDHEDWRSQIALHRLQVVVEPLRVLDDGNPRQRHEHHDASSDAAGAHKLVLRGARLPLLIKIDRE